MATERHVLRFLRDHGPVTPVALANHLGDVSTLLPSLRAAGLIERLGDGPAAPFALTPDGREAAALAT